MHKCWGLCFALLIRTIRNQTCQNWRDSGTNNPDGENWATIPIFASVQTDRADGVCKQLLSRFLPIVQLRPRWSIGLGKNNKSFTPQSVRVGKTHIISRCCCSLQAAAQLNFLVPRLKNPCKKNIDPVNDTAALAEDPLCGGVCRVNNTFRL